MLMAIAYTLVMLSCVGMTVRACMLWSLGAGGEDEQLWLSIFLLALGSMVELWPDSRNRDTYYSGVAGEWNAEHSE